MLGLEEKFLGEQVLATILAKTLKSEDWNCRKVSVDICYALLVIKEEIHEGMHSIVRELKYDKIKHVRDAVVNY